MLQLFRESLKPWFLYFRSPEYREWLRIKNRCKKQPPRTPFKISVAGFTLHAHDSASLLDQYEAVFRRRCYDFDTEQESPLIYCCGANMGLDILFLKKRFPRAKIRAFEADEKIAAVLRKNMDENAFSDVEVTQAAVWTHDTELFFEPDGQQGGKLAERGTAVKAVSLPDLLRKEKSIDLLIMDIEGAEYEVLSACKPQLQNVQRLFVEWHGRAEKMQHLDELLVLLQLAGFRYRLQNHLPDAPFRNAIVENGFDAMVDVYAEKMKR